MSVSLVPRLPLARRPKEAGDPIATTAALRVDRWDPRRDGPLTELTLERKLKSLGYDPLPQFGPQGAIVSARVHHCERVAVVVAGLLQVTIEGDSVILTAGDIVFIPGGVMRRVEPLGTSPVLCVEAVCRSERS